MNQRTAVECAKIILDDPDMEKLCSHLGIAKKVDDTNVQIVKSGWCQWDQGTLNELKFIQLINNGYKKKKSEKEKLLKTIKVMQIIVIIMVCLTIVLAILKIASVF